MINLISRTTTRRPQHLNSKIGATAVISLKKLAPRCPTQRTRNAEAKTAASHISPQHRNPNISISNSYPKKLHYTVPEQLTNDPHEGGPERQTHAKSEPNRNSVRIHSPERRTHRNSKIKTLSSAPTQSPITTIHQPGSVPRYRS